MPCRTESFEEPDLGLTHSPQEPQKELGGVLVVLSPRKNHLNPQGPACRNPCDIH